MRPRAERPRLGFLGVGWIGRHRMEAMIGSGAIEAAAIVDPDEHNAAEALRLTPGAKRVGSIDDLLGLGVDGIVIATPSALHAAQSMRALEHDVAVFCQKPLGRNEMEIRAVVDAARAHDRLLGVDLSYRFTDGMRRIRDLIRSGALGAVYAVELVFHNAYGPDKPWFYDPTLSGGGCLMDLGVHLVDLGLWALDFPQVSSVSGHLFAAGRPLIDRKMQVEDYAVGDVRLASGTIMRLGCSWRLHAGCEAVIAASFYGTEGGAKFSNVGGSFYDFQAEHLKGTTSEVITAPDDWGGRAACDWAVRLAAGDRFDPAAERFIDIAHIMDCLYQ